MPPRSGRLGSRLAGRRFSARSIRRAWKRTSGKSGSSSSLFARKPKRLLVRERFALMTAPLSPVECADAEINRLRQELFASAMSHGGRFKRLIDAVDRLLYRLITGG